MAQPVVSKSGALAADDEMIGRKVGGVEILSVLRTGALGPQYLAKMGGSGIKLVLQLLPDVLAGAEAETLDTILEQARAALAVREREVLRLIKADREGARIYFLSEFAAGTTAADLGRLSVGLATRLARGAAAALAKIHGAGLIHRDVRPENILLCDDGSIRLMGLGLTTAAEAVQELRLGLPIAGPPYCSPELYQEQTYTHRTDIYSLGATYFQLLTGRPPFQAATSLQVLHQHRTEPPPDARELDDRIPAACAAIVTRAMAKEQQNRYRTARDMGEALEVVLESLPPEPETELEPEPEPEPEPKPAAAAVAPVPTVLRTPSSITMPIPPAPLKPTSGERPPARPPSGVQAPAELSSAKRTSLVVASPAGGDSRRRSVRSVQAGGSAGWPWVAAGAAVTVLVLVAVFVIMGNRGRPAADAAKKDAGTASADPAKVPDPDPDPDPGATRVAPPDPSSKTETPPPFQPPVPTAPTFAVDGEGFIRNWLVLAPLPYNAPNDNEALTREQIAGEANLRPKEGDASGVGGKQFMWKACKTDEYKFELARDFGRGDEDSVAYAVCYVHVDAEAGDVKLKIGTDDHGRVYLNGREIFRKLAARAVKADDDVVWPVQLKKGVNVLLMKVVNMKGDFGFCARFTDKDDRPMKNLRIATAP